MKAFKQFVTSFKHLDRSFFLVWLMDVLFYVTIGVVSYATMFKFGSISQRLMELQLVEASQEVVDQVYGQAYWFFGTIALALVAIFLFYIVFQAVQWGIILRQRITLAFILRFAFYSLFALLVLAIPLVLLFGLLIALFMSMADGSGLPVILAGFMLFWLGCACMVPFVVLPSYSYFKTRKMWDGIARMFYLAFSTVPRLWLPYLLAGLVMLIVTQLYRFLWMLDSTLGGFILLAFMISPVLAWARFYIVGLLES
jgi:hypothetical protein